ncbi:MAG: VRR-NUC domain-containing protein [Bacteroidota bacterium]
MASTVPEKIILPQKYYLDYFRYLLDFVQLHYRHVLSDQDYEFIQSFSNLSEPGQCLFVRFSNRKGPMYRVRQLAYEEIPDPEAAAQELVEMGFAHRNIPNAPESFNLFTRRELFTIFDKEVATLKRQLKVEIIEHLMGAEDAYLQLDEYEPIVHVDKQDEFEYFKLLFFGQYKAQMTEFVIRDVGHVKLESLKEDQFKPWCNNRDEAMAFFEVSKLKTLIRKAIKVWPATVVHEEIIDTDWAAFRQYERSAKALDTLALELGQQLEREGEKELALAYYQWSLKPPARERQIRILDSLKRTEEASALARKLLDNYRNANERIFASDFLNRKAVRINRSMSSKLAESPVIQLEDNPDLRVEHQVMEHFAERGFQAIHSENFLWRNLFGLLLWEELFDQGQDGFHHPLQRATSDLHTPLFFEKRREFIQKKMAKLNSRQKIIRRLKGTAKQKQGLANPMVYWYEGLLEHCEALVEKLYPAQLKAVVLEQCKNIKDNSTGFPDLFIWNEQEYFFYEIKSPNDHLSAQQLFWIEFMQNQGIRADILRVQYSR